MPFISTRDQPHPRPMRLNPEQAGKTDFPVSPGNKQEGGRTTSSTGESPLLGVSAVEATVAHREASLLSVVEGR